MVADASISPAVSKLNLIRSEIGKIIVGQQSVVDGVLICLVAGGHVLLEGVPGLGKTTLLRTLGRTLVLRYSAAGARSMNESATMKPRLL